MRVKTITIFLLIAALVISAASAGGYAPIPYEPLEHQTAAQAEAIAGALVGFRGTYSTPEPAPAYRPITNRAAPVYGVDYIIVSNYCNV